MSVAAAKRKSVPIRHPGRPALRKPGSMKGLIPFGANHGRPLSTPDDAKSNVANLHAAKTHFSKLVERAAEGEEIVICKAGKPMAKLVPYREPKLPPRKPGGWEGKVWIGPNFDKLPDDLLAAFNGIVPGPSRTKRA